MSLSFTIAGSAAKSAPAASSQPPAAWGSLQVPVTCTPGDWLIAIVTWRQQSAGAGVTVHVGDDTLRNFWQPLGQPSGTSSASGVVRCAIWTAPAAQAAQFVMVAPTGTVQGIACVVLDVNGMSFWQTVTGVTTTFANAATALSALTLGAPASNAMIITACGSDLNTATVSVAGTGWGTGTSVASSNGSDHSADITLTTAFQGTTLSTSATWSSTLSQDLCGIIAGVLVTGTAPAAASPDWPVTVAELAPGAGPNTPEDQRTWVPVTAQSLALAGVVQGAQYNLSALVAGQGTITFDNPSGNLVPPGSGSFAGIDSGTPFRVRQTWTGGSWQVQWTGNGSTAGPQVDSGNIQAVVPLASYTASAWLAASNFYAGGAQIQIDWFTSGGAFISASTATVPSVSPLPQLLTVTGNAPGTAAKANVILGALGTPTTAITFTAAAAPLQGLPGYLVIPSSVAWFAENGATASTLLPWLPDPKGPPVATPYGVPFAGAVRSWPSAWDPQLLRGVCTATLADAWTYCNGNPQPILIQEILNDNPYAYWPCIDPAGSVQASNYAAGNNNPLVVTASKYGTGTVAEAFGTNSQALLGAQGTVLLTSSVRIQAQAGMWQQSSYNPSNQQQGWSLDCTDPSFPSLANGVTLETWFQITGSPLISQAMIFTWMVSAGTYIIQIGVAPTGHLLLNYVINNSETTVTLSSAVDYSAGGLYHLAFTTTTTAYQCFINGVSVASGSYSSAMPAILTMLGINGYCNPVDAIGFYNGFSGHTAVFPAILTEPRTMTHYLAGKTALAGDSPDARIERLLQAAPYTGRRVILQDSGTNVTPCASCQDIAGQSAAGSIQNIASSTVPAVLGISPPGELFYLTRQYTYNQPVRWVLGEDTSLGEIPYQADIAFSWDPLRVVNDVQYTQLDNQDVVTPGAVVEAIDLASQQQYGDQPFWVTGYLENDLLSGYAAGPGLVDVASWVGAVNAKPGQRVGQVTVDAATNPAAWLLFMQAAKGDMVTVNRRPPTAPAGTLISVTGRISQTTRDLVWSLDGCQGTISLLIDVAAEQNVLTADDSVRGQLNGKNVLAW